MNDKTPRHDAASENAGQDDGQWQAWAAELGLTWPPKFRDESLAPPVDEELLGTLLRRELPEYKARGVLILVVSFQSWYDAYTRIMLDQYHQGRRAENDECRMINDE